MEVAKLVQGAFIAKDLGMYYAENDTPAIAKTSSIIEDLGQIQFVFSDKTGTLTSNEMKFFKCCVSGKP
jgi:phospholipid-transporting ATPase